MQTIHTFRVWLREQGYAGRTIEQYLSYARRARLELGPLHRVDADELRVWWATLPASPSSRNSARNALLAYYRHRGRTDGGPAQALPCIPDHQRLPRPVSREAYDQLFAAADDLGGRHQLLYHLLALTGCRISEARTARRSQIDHHAPSWRIEGKGSRRRGPKERVVWLHPRLLGLLRTWPEPDWLFPAPHRPGPVHRTTAGQWWRELVEHAGLDATSHQIRHAVATIGLEQSRDVRAVQELLGHANLGTTQIYTQVTGSRLRDVVSTLGPAA